MTILKQLQNFGLTIKSNGNKIIVNPSQKITPAIRNLIKLHKEELIELLAHEKSKKIELRKLIKKVSDLHGDGDTEADLVQDLSDILQNHDIDDALACFRKVVIDNEWRKNDK